VERTEKSSELYANIQIAGGAVALIWAIHLISGFLHFQVQRLGIVPRSTDAIWGILMAPFIHANLGHLISNSGALFVLLIMALSLNRSLAAAALTIIVIGGGGAVWAFGAPRTVHVGASGVIFGLIGFLSCIGIFQKRWKTLIFSIVVLVAYGGALWSLFILKPGVSWSSHFWGLAFGVIAAWMLRKMRS